MYSIWSFSCTSNSYEKHYLTPFDVSLQTGEGVEETENLITYLKTHSYNRLVDGLPMIQIICGIPLLHKDMVPLYQSLTADI